MVDRELSGQAWFKSSYSSNSGECVEVVSGGGCVMVRDSKKRGDGALAFRHEAWCGFLAGLVNPETRDT